MRVVAVATRSLHHLVVRRVRQERQPTHRRLPVLIRQPRDHRFHQREIEYRGRFPYTHASGREPQMDPAAIGDIAQPYDYPFFSRRSTVIDIVAAVTPMCPASAFKVMGSVSSR